ncbi:hypothetical protein Mro03_39190 [Microbispora rosea subsp. rosea]|nr:hypothetical protein Mro03_39190 [Microbispora rosea subsp. rosea]
MRQRHDRPTCLSPDGAASDETPQTVPARLPAFEMPPVPAILLLPLAGGGLATGLVGADRVVQVQAGVRA